MSRVVQDFRHAVRACLRAPLVSGLAVLAFALGIGVTTTVFNIFYSVLLKPLPFPDAHELVAVYDTQPACATCPASFPKYTDWKARNQVFAAIGGSTQAGFVMSGSGDPVQVAAAQTTASLVDVFGVRPLYGRWFSEAEDQPGGRKVVVLSHAFWTQHFGRNPGVLGRGVTFNGEGYEVIGVMPADFSHRRADVFVPLQRKLDPATRGSHFLVTYARLKPGVTADRAATAMRALGQSLATEFGTNHGVDVRSYREVVVGAVRPQLRMLLGAVFAVLLIGCANVANLLLAAGMARRRELGIRLALGARTGDLARQLIAESTLLASIGGTLGVLLALWLLRTFVVLAGNQLPRASTVAMDGRVLLFTAAVTIGVGIFCGLWPLLRLRTRELAASVREGDSRTASSVSNVGNGLVVAEIAIAFTLLVGGGLLVKNLLALQNRDTGFEVDRIITFDLAPAGPRYTNPAATLNFYRDLQARLSQVGGVQHVGFISHLPMYSFGTNGEMQVEGKLPWDPKDAPLVEYRWFYGDYFKALGIPLIRGRYLDGRDGEKTRTVLINRTMAEKFWPGEDALGKRFGQGTDRSQWWEVVGIVGDTKSYGLASRQPYEFYRNIEQAMFPSQTVVLRATGADPAALIPTAKEIVR